jgi:hypothetical protein
MIQAESTPTAPPAGRRTAPPPHDPRPRAGRADDGTADFEELIIRPLSGWVAINWKEMWSHRELL